MWGKRVVPGGLSMIVLHGADRKQNFAAIARHDIVLTTYPLIARDRDVLLTRGWHMAVLDEAQTVKRSSPIRQPRRSVRCCSGSASHRSILFHDAPLPLPLRR